jgi:hypothetical protein
LYDIEIACPYIKLTVCYAALAKDPKVDTVAQVLATELNRVIYARSVTIESNYNGTSWVMFKPKKLA